MVLQDIVSNPFFLNFNISVDDNTICYYTDVTLEAVPENEEDPGILYEWDFGVDAIPPTAIGVGPHTIHYTSSGSKTVTCTASHGSVVSEEQFIITVSSCAGNIAGSIYNHLDVPLGSGFNIRLYEDFDEDGVADGAFIRNVFSNSSGTFALASLIPGWYILEANFADEDVTFVDTASIEPTVDALIVVPGVTTPTKKAVRIYVRPSIIEGVIKLTVDQS